MATFKAKARAVELLGKGQIADLPTAITELWKNGYDAYAKTLSCKLFLDSYKDNTSPIFLLSDDGFGMSETDILDRWFVLGTDSKARGKDMQPVFNLEKRIPMGEKGIGRLSVSYLGSQMLMLTKKKGKKANAMVLDWRILDNYDFFLEDLHIPLFSFEKEEEFQENFCHAKESFNINLKENLWKEQKELRDVIFAEWNSIAVPVFIYEEVVRKFCDPDFHGTSFIIFTPHDQLVELSSADRFDSKEDNSLVYLRASLSGLHNDLANPEKDFETHFYIYDATGRRDLIDDFFTQEEMRSADHWLKGEFDEKGFFTGEIRIFNKREKYSFRPTRPPGNTSYGPFSIEWGSVEGNISSTTLNEEQFQIINNKLKTFGGLYIYRDEFRVLPYGRTDVDFLEFEKRRSLGAGYYYFSHRRFIGYIDISRKKNPALKDKAGREGFIQNKAYREFREDLIEFFIDIAKRYMRIAPEGEENTFRQTQISEIQAKFKRQVAAAKKKNKKTKKAFLLDLRENFKVLEDFQTDINQLKTSIEIEANNLEINYNIYHRLVDELEKKKENLRNLKIVKPQGVNVTQRESAVYRDYQKLYQIADQKVSLCDEMVANTRERINTENLKLEYQDKFRSHVRFIEKQFDQFRSITKNSFERIDKSLREEKDLQIEHFKTNSTSVHLKEDESKEEINSKIKGLHLLTEDHVQKINNSFGGFINHLENLQIDVDDDFLRGWYQEQNEKLEQRLKDYEELAQVGISIEIIDHQFNVMYGKMNEAIKEIEGHTKDDKNAQYQLKQLKAAFQHLEGNYKLLKPLYKTSRRSREKITGRDIEHYIQEFFKVEFERFRINFSVNENFKNFEFFTFESIIKPVFLNIISNANYWLIPVDNRQIKIEYEEDEIRIMNSGEPIDESNLEDIFTLFFTRKREGRGIGLYLAKRNLQSIGYDLFATNNKEKNKLKGACFIIRKSKNIL